MAKFSEKKSMLKNFSANVLKGVLWFPMARLSSHYSDNFNIQYVHYSSFPYFLFSFCIFLFASLFFIFLPINLYIRVLAHLYLFCSLYFICVLYFLYLLLLYFFGCEWEFFIFFLISMQHVITWPRCTFYSAILSFGHMEEELSTACRAAADALEILSNLRPGFTRNIIPLINSSTAVSVSQANSGEGQVNDDELHANESAVQSSMTPISSSSIQAPLPTLFPTVTWTVLVGKLLVEDQQGQSRPLRCLHRVLTARAPMMRALVMCAR